MRTLTALVQMVLVVLIGFATTEARADFITNVTIVDPTNSYTAYHSKITSHAIAAGNLWGAHFAGTTSLELEIIFNDAFPRATGRSTISSHVANRNGFSIAEQGVGAEIRTGVDPNGAASDLIFTFNPDYLQNNLWFDPNPFSRTEAVPNLRTDAMSVFLHEYAHAIAFNGWQHHTNGTYVDNYRSTYDELKTFDGTNFYFNGPKATALYGGPVPVTYGNVNHIGNGFPLPGETPRPGTDLIPDLMNGVVFHWATRYDISPMDLAIISDTGLDVVATPEPSTMALFSLAGFIYLCRVRVTSWLKARSRPTKKA